MYFFLPRTDAYDAFPSSFDTFDTIACAPGDGDPSGKMYSADRSDAVSVSFAHGVTSRSSHVPTYIVVCKQHEYY